MASPLVKIDESFVAEVVNSFKNNKLPSIQAVLSILNQSKSVLTQLPSLVHIPVSTDEPLTVCGDTHVQFRDLLHIFEVNGWPTCLKSYLFNGDFVDRGEQSVEVILTLLCYKILYPKNFHLTRGNHESISMNQHYGFRNEVFQKFGKKDFFQIYPIFTDVFNSLPLAAVVAEAVFVVHGGLPRHPLSLQAILDTNRFRQPDENRLISDLLWSDPLANGQGCLPNPRGAGVLFGADITKRFLLQNRLKLLIRSHEKMDEGYLWQHDNKCLTLFSAANYCGNGRNKGAFVNVFSNGEIKIGQFVAVHYPIAEGPTSRL
eukprot:Lithocolla_globosa_v1_NODE_83_length_6704_cov_20.431945.p2 type:complete len:317 gc:universal NODE_83_length_6704_cov_20.431945:954-4(-)